MEPHGGGDAQDTTTAHLHLDDQQADDPAAQLASVPHGRYTTHLVLHVPSSSSQRPLLPALHCAFLLHSMRSAGVQGALSLQSITELDLRGARYRIPDAEAAGLGECFAACFPNLSSLLLTCEFSPAFLHSLAAQPLSHLSTLSIGPYFEVDSRDTQALASLQHLTSLTISCDCIRSLSPLSQLHSLVMLKWELGFAAHGSREPQDGAGGTDDNSFRAQLGAVLAGCTRLQHLGIARHCAAFHSTLHSTSLRVLELGHLTLESHNAVPDLSSMPRLQQLCVQRLSLPCLSYSTAERAQFAWEQLSTCEPAHAGTDALQHMLFKVACPRVRLVCGTSEASGAWLAAVASAVLALPKQPHIVQGSVTSLTITHARIQHRDVWELSSSAVLGSVESLCFYGCKLSGSSLMEAVQGFQKLSRLVVVASNIGSQEAASSVIACACAGQARKSGARLRIEVAPYPASAQPASQAEGTSESSPKVQGLLRGWAAVAEGFCVECLVDVVEHCGLGEFI